MILYHRGSPLVWTHRLIVHPKDTRIMISRRRAHLVAGIRPDIEPIAAVHHRPCAAPTCLDPPTHWETPRQHAFHAYSSYDQPLQSYRQPQYSDTDPYWQRRRPYAYNQHNPPGWPPPQCSPCSGCQTRRQRTTNDLIYDFDDGESDLIYGVDEGESESIYDPNDFWDTYEYEEDVSDGYMKQPMGEEAWFLARETLHPPSAEHRPSQPIPSRDKTLHPPPATLLVAPPTDAYR